MSVFTEVDRQQDIKGFDVPAFKKYLVDKEKELQHLRHQLVNKEHLIIRAKDFIGLANNNIAEFQNKIAANKVSAQEVQLAQDQIVFLEIKRERQQQTLKDLEELHDRIEQKITNLESGVAEKLREFQNGMIGSGMVRWNQQEYHY
ncbi:hypothetical protein [Persicobacter diffluens]|uniref:Uncharacterized protein n=1 Tax=Persicobacter diffluens TaxID=981 RepID=A0AAN4VY75_9BACT|nr:hypothetical protein PEDI_15290 [Persicobacter diffluens]